MNKFLTLTKEQRAAVFERVGAGVGLPMQAVEKDFGLQLFYRQYSHYQWLNT